jgi:hypothetical protein
MPVPSQAQHARKLLISREARPLVLIIDDDGWIRMVPTDLLTSEPQGPDSYDWSMACPQSARV